MKKFYAYLVMIPTLLVILGAASNQAVLIANHGKFPVMLNEFQVQKFIEAQQAEEEKLEARKHPAREPVFTITNTSVDRDQLKLGQFLDSVHSVMGPNSRLKAMADVFDLGGGIYSIGDFAIILGEYFFPYLALLFLALNALRFTGLRHVSSGLFGLLALRGALALVDYTTIAVAFFLVVVSAIGVGTYLLGKTIAHTAD